MSSNTSANSTSSPATDSPKQRPPTPRLRRQESTPSTPRTASVEQHKPSQQHIPLSPRILLEKVPKCKDLWFEDGDVIIWAEGKQGSLLFRVHRRVLKESRTEPLCTVVDCDYPNPDTSEETFLDGVWVLKYGEQNPAEIMHVIRWMYERPSTSKRSTIPFAALETYLERSDAGFVPAMRRCALEYLWTMLPTNLNYHQRIPTLVEDCYSEHSDLFYKPHLLLNLAALAKRHQLITILPLLYYYIAQWPIEWITDGVPVTAMEFNSPPNDPGVRLPQSLAITILAGREKLIRLRETKVFNFMESFTLNGTSIDFPIGGCDGEKRQKTGETCFQWLMRAWFFMGRSGFIARPAALDIMNMGQWAELKRHCCEPCAKRVMEHMLTGRDDIWDALPSVFGYHDWTYVLEQQQKVEEEFEAVIT